MRMVNFTKGQLLLEILVIIAVISIVATLGGQLVLVSLTSNKTVSEREVARDLLTEGFEATKSISDESWQDVYNLTKGGVQYYPQIQGGKWVTFSGADSIIVNGINYTRYFTTDDVNRDASGDIATAGTDDPSTQKITSN